VLKARGSPYNNSNSKTFFLNIKWQYVHTFLPVADEASIKTMVNKNTPPQQ
jgi:hypothetical protein